MSSQVVIISEDITDQVKNDQVYCVEKEEPRYEDKFLDDIRKMNNEFIFDEKEQELERNKFDEFLLFEQKEYRKKVDDVNDQITSIEKQINEYERDSISDDDFCNVKYNENVVEENENKDAIKKLTEERVELEKVLSELCNLQNIDELRLKIKAKTRQFVIDERLDKLKNNYVMDKTPLGNVLMLYNNKRGSFEFYSDNTIPYRYLEPVSRKYVKMFDCRPIYFDMKEELNNYEKKLEEKDKEEKRLEEQKKNQGTTLGTTSGTTLGTTLEPTKKNVFAKFKSYNKEAGTGHVNMAAPPKNSIPNTKVTEKNTSEKILLKENANRYSYEGKLSNFNFLKKVDRKVVDKKYGMTFADFKRLQEEKNKKNN